MSATYPEWYKLPIVRWQRNPMIFGERDSQQQKLYDAQSLTKCFDQVLNQHFSSLEKIQHFTNGMLVSSWYRKRFGTQTITVYGKKGYGADANVYLKRTRYSETSRSLLTVLHEIAHIAHSNRTSPSHGRLYARILLAIVEHAVGKESAKTLKSAFNSHNVKYLPFRVLSKETKEILRQNFIKNVLKQKVGA